MAALTHAIDLTRNFILATAATLSPADRHTYLGEMEDWIEDEYLLSADDLEEEPDPDRPF